MHVWEHGGPDFKRFFAVFFVSMTFLRASGPPRFTSGPHLRASPAQKLVIILDQGPPRFLGGPEVNFPNQWMDTVDKIRVKSAQ